jgi:hypothetical protein
MNLQSSDNIIDEMVKQSKLHRLNTEMVITNNNTLQNIIQQIEGTSNEKESIKARTKLDILFKKQDEYALKKKWQRLLLQQKIDRIKYFVETKIEEDKKKETEKFLLDNIDMIKTVKQILYDDEKGEIVSVAILDKRYIVAPKQ